jgi:hypothetical protein
LVNRGIVSRVRARTFDRLAELLNDDGGQRLPIELLRIEPERHKNPNDGARRVGGCPKGRASSCIGLI